MDDTAIDLLGRCPEDPNALARLLELGHSGELRDAVYDRALGGALGKMLMRCWLLDCKESDECVSGAHDLFSLLVSFPEFTQDVARATCTMAVVQGALDRAEAHANPEEEGALASVICTAYEHGVEVRPELRVKLGGVLRRAAKLGDEARALAGQLSMVLRVVCKVVRGFATPLARANVELLNELVLPLHAIPGKVSHQTPVISLFHHPLASVLRQFVIKDPELVPSVLFGITRHWPSPWAGNSPKEVLLLHELEAMLELADPATLLGGGVGTGAARSLVTDRVAACIASDNSTVCERALKLWENETVGALLCTEEAMRTELLPRIAGVLIGAADAHWNETVRRMAAVVLRRYLAADAELLERLAARVWAGGDEQAQAEVAEGKRDGEETKSVALGGGGRGPAPAASAWGDPELGEGEGGVSPGAASEAARRLAALLDAADPPKSARQLRREAKEAKEAEGTRVPAQRHDSTVHNMVHGHELGKGSFATVYYAMRVIPGEARAAWPKYAVKQLEKRHREVAQREIEMMERVVHPNVTRLVATYESSRAIHLVLELAALGDLHTPVDVAPRASPRQRLQVLRHPVF